VVLDARLAYDDRGDERRARRAQQPERVYVDSALKPSGSPLRVKMSFRADSPAAAGTVRRIVSMSGNSWKTPRKISCATST
jgi:hypothetical protein